ncbi:EF-hand domain-containing protein [Actinomadura gamaensis]|uniref:EF-hand domain-containing protein n=1 Tax=Actinomadura gamaensis TaxID=1763541 RepID=A0ABV9TTI5_9ACTN
MPQADILRAKIEYGFDHFLDADGDGRLTERDHILMGRRMAGLLGHAPGSAAERDAVEAYVGIWRDLHLPHLPPGSTALTREDFVRSTMTLAADRRAAQATVGALAERFLQVADVDRDGHVDREEYATFLRGHNPDIADQDIADAFAHLDGDADGRLTTTEFTNAVVDYWSSASPDAPGNWWLGRPAYER